MFRCEQCGIQSLERESPRRIVTARREPVRYPETGRLNGPNQGEWAEKKRARDGLGYPRRLGRPGWEIAAEATVCVACAGRSGAPLL